MLHTSSEELLLFCPRLPQDSGWLVQKLLYNGTVREWRNWQTRKT